MASQQRKFTLDVNTRLKDTGAVTSSAADQVSSADVILDLGAARMEGVVVIDVTAIDVASGDEKYEIEWQLSSSSSFASGNVCAAVVKLGDSTVNGSSADSTTGRIELHVTNEFQGTTYRYARTYHRLAGTTPSITYTASLCKK